MDIKLDFEIREVQVERMRQTERRHRLPINLGLMRAPQAHGLLCGQSTIALRETRKDVLKACRTDCRHFPSAGSEESVPTSVYGLYFASQTPKRERKNNYEQVFHTRFASKACIRTAALLLPSSPHMRAAAILGLGCSPKNLRPFQTEQNVDWSLGLPSVRSDADIILVFGGDGTIHRHLVQLVRLGQPVLVVPSGSGNDFARALGFRTVQDSLAFWRKFCQGTRNIRRIDLGVIAPLANAHSALAPHYFACVAGIGLDAEVARRANKIPRWLRGNGGYALTLIPTIFRFSPFRVKILTSAARDSAEHSVGAVGPAERMLSEGDWHLQSNQPTMLAAFANGPLYGGGMKIAPHAKLDDGLLDVCVVGSVDAVKLFCMFPTVYFGRHLKIREVEYSQAARVRVETERPLDIYADGEFVCQTPAEITVQSEALTVLMP